MTVSNFSLLSLRALSREFELKVPFSCQQQTAASFSQSAQDVVPIVEINTHNK